ncbi:MAG: VanZ family protein [Bacteroidota bacterium]
MKFLPAITWFIITFILLTLPGSAFPKQSWLDNIQFDKIVHIALFAILVTLFFKPFIKAHTSNFKKKTQLIQIAGLAFVYGILMEFVQKIWIPNRSFDFFDIVADGLGSFLPLLFFRQILKWGNKWTE